MLKLHLHIFLKGAFNTSTQVNIDLVQLIVFYLYKQKYKTTFGCEKAHSNKIITHSPTTSLSFNPHLWPLSFGWPSPVFFFIYMCWSCLWLKQHLFFHNWPKRHIRIVWARNSLWATNAAILIYIVSFTSRS